MARTTNKYTFRSRPDDPAPLTYTLVGFLKSGYLAVPATTDELLDVLREWLSEDELPTYHALYSALKRAKGVRTIPGRNTRFTTSTDAELQAGLLDRR